MMKKDINLSRVAAGQRARKARQKQRKLEGPRHATGEIHKEHCPIENALYNQLKKTVSMFQNYGMKYPQEG